PVIIESSAVIKDGKVTGLRGFIMDISDRKQLEYERQRISKLDSLSLLTAGIAHDFNNILTVIIGNISLASMIIDGEDKAYKYLQKASNAVNMAKDLTEKLLMFSKGIEPNKKIISAEKIIRETVDLCLYNKTTKCIIDIPEDLVNIDADSVQIGQVFQNLIINAEQAMPKGGTIKITGKNIDLSENNIYNLPKGKYVEITVSDEGIGISKENLQRIFEPYFTTKDKGNGLGLATAYGIIKKHGGFINVTSVVGVGTTFVIYLPSSMS
ncbi:MAG TPA: hybrid sensor histidine kinase/response regulator, partial [Nitrospirae bacterium]|nr:hybrid sensor histidine kinase/response regulator [Nitrospirota bacterium]